MTCSSAVETHRRSFRAGTGAPPRGRSRPSLLPQMEALQSLQCAIVPLWRVRAPTPSARRGLVLSSMQSRWHGSRAEGRPPAGGGSPAGTRRRPAALCVSKLGRPRGLAEQGPFCAPRLRKHRPDVPGGAMPAISDSLSPGTEHISPRDPRCFLFPGGPAQATPGVGPRGSIGFALRLRAGRGCECSAPRGGGEGRWLTGGRGSGGPLLERPDPSRAGRRGRVAPAAGLTGSTCV